jgi:hypothetical protein
LPAALALSATAERTLAKVLGSEEKARRLVLSLFFRAALGIERIFHFETVDDVGFATLSGGDRVLTRTTLGGLVRAVDTEPVKQLVLSTEQLEALRGKDVTASLDEHTIARFTRKFRIPKGFHTLRNKKMRVEKVSYLFWPAMWIALLVIVSRGNVTLADLAVRMHSELERLVKIEKLRLILDAGAAQRNEDLVRLDRARDVVFLIRAPRRKGDVDRWKRLPRESFSPFEEPGRYVGAKAKECEWTETTTRIKGIDKPVRTLVFRERAQHGKDRWHALFILHDDTTQALELLHEYRTRQRHEQFHRIGVHDLWLDTCPSGYPKSGRPDRPGFRQGPLLLCAWIISLVWDALRALGDSLPKRFHHAHPRTLRRWVLMRDAELILTPTHLVVVLESARRRSWLRPLLRKFNEAEVVLPWLGGRRVVMGFAACSQPLADARPVLPADAQPGQQADGQPVPPAVAKLGSDCAGGLRSVWC